MEMIALAGEQVEELVDIFLERMGLSGHQAIFGLHHDTDNYHPHIAVNRMNPETGKVMQPHKGFDKKEAHKIVTLIEHKQGWESEKKALYTVLENGELARRRKGREVKPSQAALNFEHARGEKSAQRIAQERGHGIISNAKTWSELRRRLAEIGLRFEKADSGALVFVGDIAVKASSVDRAFSMKKLRKKLGDFVPGDYPDNGPDAPEKIPPEPISSVNIEEWKEYQAEYAGTPEKSRGPEENIELARTKKLRREERQNALSKLAKYGLPILNIARHCLKAQQAQELRQARRQTRKKRGGKPRFETWLRSRGLNKQADRWRYRAGLEPARKPAQVSANGSTSTTSSDHTVGWAE